MVDDSELLCRYAETHSEAAFSELVKRHLSLVYHAAMRRSGGDTHRAADVTQTVFTALARDAAKLSRHPMLSAWLHAATRNAAIDANRSEFRRKNREHTAHLMQEVSFTSDAPADWDRVRPVIDEVLDELGENEREAVLLRYLEEQSFAVVGKKLSVSEDAARMRVDRALDKMRDLLARRGILSTGAILAAALANEATAATPPGLAATVTSFAIASSATVATTATAGVSTFAKLMFGLACAAAAVTTTGLVILRYTNARLRAETVVLRETSANSASTATAPATPANDAAGIQIERAHAEIARLQRELQEARTGGSAGSNADTGNSTIPMQLMMPVESRYVVLFRQLNLTRDQLNILNNLLGEKQRRLDDFIQSLLNEGIDPETKLPEVRRVVSETQAEVNQEIRTRLGDEVLAKYQKYEGTLIQRNTINQLEQMMRGSPSPLSEEQVERMVDLLHETHENEGPGGIGRLTSFSANYHSRISVQTINAAASILSEPQLRALERLRQSQGPAPR